MKEKEKEKEQQTIEDLDKEMAELAVKRQKLLDITRADVLSKTLKVLEAYKFTAVELGLVVAPVVIETRPRKQRSDKRSPDEPKVKAPPKYANPDDPQQTWAGGKGARPKWVQSLLNAGGDLETTLIKK
jgi:DNA-binding protein H-NS